MKVMVRIVIGIVFALYPIVVYIGLVKGSVRTVALALLAVVAVRFMVLSGAKSSGLQAWSIWLITAVITVLLSLAFYFNESQYFLFYPVIVSVLLLGVFATSLLRPPTIIEQLARIQEPNLPPQGVVYTRKVTWVWCGFFLLNGSIALYTVTQSLEVWALYNGLVSYVLMGILFSGEFIVRHFVIKRQASES